MAKCDLCGKKAQFGHHVSHSKHRSKRRWLPNIRSTTLVIGGKEKRLNICMRCLRTQHKLGL